MNSFAQNNLSLTIKVMNRVKIHLSLPVVLSLSVDGLFYGSNCPSVFKNITSVILYTQIFMYMLSELYLSKTKTHDLRMSMQN